ncbi:hypothetical protein C9374_009262 [Naegleria lovaniensis]|uniref:Heparin-sulfate lyase N-terminal domain-containing protein n=1 Tax=Naegleria lovaniensis TaxID=51637 RepID=A0AA88KGN4_NAELO|nr:uncharacterized protein C9374_009262 [Naegleria lovaniensis]KAG2377351.1 hypothetical protein C9374_009262 [Naegleria lovaniensis]
MSQLIAHNPQPRLPPHGVGRNLQWILMLVLVACKLLLVHGADTNKLVISSCSNGQAWTATKGSTKSNPSVDSNDLPAPGITGSLVWSFSQFDALTFVKPSSDSWDLSTRRNLKLWIKAPSDSNVPTTSKFLFMYLGNQKNGENIFYYTKISLDFSGWKEFLLSKGSFFYKNSLLPWNTVDTIVLRFSGLGQTASDALTIKVGEISMSDVSGPVLTDTEFFNTLDYDSFSGLAQVKSSIQSGDLGSAKSNLCSYFKSRTNVTWSINPFSISLDNLSPSPYSSWDSLLKDAEYMLQGYVNPIGIAYQYPDLSKLDWNFNPTALAGSKNSYDPTWTWNLARFEMMESLGKAYWYSIAKPYSTSTLTPSSLLNLFSTYINTWIQTQPRPSIASQGDFSNWRTIEAGIRLLNSWPKGYHYFLSTMSCSDLILMLKSFHEQASYLNLFPTEGNWLTMEMNGLYTTGSLFPEFKDSSRWRTFSSQQLAADQGIQFLKDGAHYELSTQYHQIAIENMMGLYETAQRVGRLHELPSDYTFLLGRALEFNVKVMTPSGMMPGPLNDGAMINAMDMSEKYRNVFPNSSLIAWSAERKTAVNNKYSEPAFRSVFLPNAGFAVMRSGWSASDHYALMDVGPLGHAHEHQDKLNIILEPYGRSRLLFDNGGGNYDTSKYREFALSSHSHNVLLVDQLSQTRVRDSTNGDPLGFGASNTRAAFFESTPQLDYCRGTYMDSYGRVSSSGTVTKVLNRPVHHQRELIFVNPFAPSSAISFYMVVDTIGSLDGRGHEYELRWNLRTKNIKENRNMKAISTSDEGENMHNLNVVALSKASDVTYAQGQQNNPMIGWDVQRGQIYTPITTIQHRQYGYAATFVTLLIPMKSGDSSLGSNSLQQVQEKVMVGDYEQEWREYRVVFSQGIEMQIHLDRVFLNTTSVSPQHTRSLRIVQKVKGLLHLIRVYL